MDSPIQEDLINLYSGYPIVNGTLRISSHTQTGKGDTPDDGFFYEVVDADKYLFSRPEFQNAKNWGKNHKQFQGDPNFGQDGGSVNKNGNLVHYDKWDINPLTNGFGQKILKTVHLDGNADFAGKSFELYTVESEDAKKKRQEKEKSMEDYKQGNWFLLYNSPISTKLPNNTNTFLQNRYPNNLPQKAIQKATLKSRMKCTLLKS